MIVVINLSTELGNYFKGREYRHFVAPFDVVLIDEDKINKIQPDLTVICGKEGLGEQNYTGIPTLVVEVLFPSTASNDFIRKMGLYMKVGVKEYWIISPQNKTVQIFTLNEDSLYSEPIMYSKEDMIKSVVFFDLKMIIKIKGDCSIL